MFTETVHSSVQTPVQPRTKPKKQELHFSYQSCMKDTEEVIRYSPVASVSPQEETVSGFLPDYLTPRMVKFFLMAIVFMTALYAGVYQGEYQQVINNHVGSVFHVMFASLAFSYLFKKMRSWKAVLYGSAVCMLLKVPAWAGFSFMASLSQSHLLHLSAWSFKPAGMVCCILGASLSLLVLWSLHLQPSQEQPSEIYQQLLQSI
jgi:hypothetical protein